MDVEPSAISSANFAFSVDLLNQNLAPEGQNLVFSPFSASLLLLMARFGALGKTGSQIDKVLHFNQTENLDELVPTRRGFFRVLDSIRKSSNSPDYQVTIASRMYTQMDLKINETFRNVSKKVLDIQVREVDFWDGKNTSETINNWVESTTRGKINELFTPESFTEDTKLVMVNAIYFKSPWKYPFDNTTTAPTKFHLRSGKTATVDMMSLTEQFSYKDLPDLDARMVIIPYRADHASMQVIIPNRKDGLDTLIRGLNSTTLDDLKKDIITPGNCEEVRLSLPKFKIESTLNLVQPLQQLGAVDMFSATNANFRGITKGTRIFASEIRQKAFIQVDEEGTEAAATTDIQARLSCTPTVTEITADRPFYYQIVDGGTGIALFAGTVRNPKA